MSFEEKYPSKKAGPITTEAEFEAKTIPGGVITDAMKSLMKLAEERAEKKRSVGLRKEKVEMILDSKGLWDYDKMRGPEKVGFWEDYAISQFENEQKAEKSRIFWTGVLLSGVAISKLVSSAYSTYKKYMESSTGDLTIPGHFYTGPGTDNAKEMITNGRIASPTDFSAMIHDILYESNDKKQREIADAEMNSIYLNITASDAPAEWSKWYTSTTFLMLGLNTLVHWNTIKKIGDWLSMHRRTSLLEYNRVFRKDYRELLKGRRAENKLNIRGAYLAIQQLKDEILKIPNGEITSELLKHQEDMIGVIMENIATYSEHNAVYKATLNNLKDMTFTPSIAEKAYMFFGKFYEFATRGAFTYVSTPGGLVHLGSVVREKPVRTVIKSHLKDLGSFLKSYGVIVMPYIFGSMSIGIDIHGDRWLASISNWLFNKKRQLLGASDNTVIKYVDESQAVINKAMIWYNKLTENITPELRQHASFSRDLDYQNPETRKAYNEFLDEYFKYRTVVLTAEGRTEELERRNERDDRLLKFHEIDINPRHILQTNDIRNISISDTVEPKAIDIIPSKMAEYDSALPIKSDSVSERINEYAKLKVADIKGMLSDFNKFFGSKTLGSKGLKMLTTATKSAGIAGLELAYQIVDSAKKSDMMPTDFISSLLPEQITDMMNMARSVYEKVKKDKDAEFDQNKILAKSSSPFIKLAHKIEESGYKLVNEDGSRATPELVAGHGGSGYGGAGSGGAWDSTPKVEIRKDNITAPKASQSGGNFISNGTINITSDSTKPATKEKCDEGECPADATAESVKEAQEKDATALVPYAPETAFKTEPETVGPEVQPPLEESAGHLYDAGLDIKQPNSQKLLKVSKQETRANLQNFIMARYQPTLRMEARNNIMKAQTYIQRERQYTKCIKTLEGQFNTTDMRALYKSIPRESREEVLKRDRRIQEGARQAPRVAKYVASYDFKTHRNTNYAGVELRRMGMGPVPCFRQLTPQIIRNKPWMI